MSFTTETTMTVYRLPDDREEALRDLIAFIDSAQAGECYRQIMYGFTYPALVDAILRAHQRTVDCRLILDHSQSAGPAEAAQLHRMLLAGFPADALRIGTSTEHQIIHMKCAFIYGKDVADAQFKTWQEARVAFYPVTIEGSFNWSASALKQMNTLLAIPGKMLCAEMQETFERQWAWLTQNEPHYQTLTS